MRVLVLGATRSGKSAIAERLAGDDVVYVATGTASDAEMAVRIEVHRARRPDSWTTVETLDLPDPDATVLVDALDTWLAARMTDAGLWTDADIAALSDEEQRAADAILDDLGRWWTSRRADTIVVAGQPGWGPTPADASMRRYLDLHGAAVQRLADAADRVILAVAGRPIDVVGGPAAVPAPLREHGDTQVPPGALDLAVNVLPTPDWLRDRLVKTLDDAAAYPRLDAARAAAAARHGVAPEACLLLNGAAEAFPLLAEVLRPRLAACVHPSFTAPEAALRAAGVAVTRVFRDPADWSLDPSAVPDDADLVVLGRPDNPTGRVDPVTTIAALHRPGRTVVVDEAFADFLPDGGLDDLPGTVRIRSCTKLWGLAGVRVGYLLADPALVARLDGRRQPWPVSATAAEAVLATIAAEDERRQRAAAVAAERERLTGELRARGLTVWPSGANFLLAHGEPGLRQHLLDRGVAVRRCDTFPGLDATYLRIAVRDRAASDRLLESL